MLILALDTSTRAGSVAVVRGATVLGVVPGDPTRTHGERLPAEIARALEQAQVTAREVTLLAVASGPGAFTGLRIGLAAMQGLAMVLNLPVIAVSALDALALSAYRGADGAGLQGQSALVAVAAWMDAQRGEVFAADYAPLAGDELPTPLATPSVGQPDALLRDRGTHAAAAFVGDGAVRYRAQIQQANPAHRVIEPPPALAPFIAWIGGARAARGEAGLPHALQPLYVRRPDAELERARRTADDAGR